jgi:phosphoserine phosphatase RsbU/P
MQAYNEVSDFGEIREELLHQRKEVTDSLHYASYIQSALLPTLDEWLRFLPDSFIYYKPCNIVSGDFYWINKSKDILTTVVADCTGHGVPGAFMSILGISFLNEIFSRGNINSSNSILNQLRERVMKTLHQTGNWGEPKDGMDISLCMINVKNHLMQYAGANQSMYLIRDNVLTEVKGDIMPIGIGGYEEKSFTNYSIQLEDGDFIYLFTDGFVDQFGGKESKKFKYQRFRDLIINIHAFPSADQCDQFNHTLNEWKGENTQVDDILVVGFKYQY